MLIIIKLIKQIFIILADLVFNINVIINLKLIEYLKHINFLNLD